MRATLLILATLAGCKAKEPPPTPTPAPVVSAAPEAPSAAPVASVEPRRLVTSVLFEKSQLVQCEEMTLPTSKWAELLPQLKEKLSNDKRPDTKEIVQEDKSCQESTGRPAQATCTKPGYVLHVYDAKALNKSDAHMKACLEQGGNWAVNDDPKAAIDALGRAAEQFRQ